MPSPIIITRIISNPFDCINFHPALCQEHQLLLSEKFWYREEGCIVCNQLLLGLALVPIFQRYYLSRGNIATNSIACFFK